MKIIKPIGYIALGILMAVVYYTFIRNIEPVSEPIIIENPQDLILRAAIERERDKTDSLKNVIHLNQQRFNSLRTRYTNLEYEHEKYLNTMAAFTDDQHLEYFIKRTTRTNSEHN